MKKKIIGLLLLLSLIMPFSTLAATKKYNTLNLEKALEQEEIEHDLSNYKEDDKQAVIYLFRGKGCGYCRNFLTFLNSIVDEYGKYFKVVSYEVWYDQDNGTLMQEVSDFLGANATGVPFIVIGCYSFSFVCIIDAEIFFPFLFGTVPFQGLAFNHALVVIVLIVVLHIVGKCTSVHFVNGLTYHYSIFFYWIINQLTIITACRSNKRGHEKNYG